MQCCSSQPLPRLVVSQCVYVIPEVYQKLQKCFSIEEKGTFACLNVGFCPYILRLHEAFDVLVILLTHRPYTANSNCRSYEYMELKLVLFSLVLPLAF